MRIVVIGATGNVGVATVEALAADPQVTSVLGLARRTPDLVVPGVEWASADIEHDDLGFVAGADAVIHLAWKIQPQHDPAAMHATNVVGTQRVIDAVIAHGVPALIAASSVGAYASAPKQPRLDEDWPATGIAASVYSRHKAEVEALLDQAEARAPELRVVRMRTSLVFQGRAASEIHRLFLGRLAPWHLPKILRLVPRDARLSLQATHAGDVAAAYCAAATRQVRGAFNIAAEPLLTPERIAECVGGRVIPLPVAALRVAAAATFRLRLQPTEAGWIDMATGVPVMETSRARRELGWCETVPADAALAELLACMGTGAGEATASLHPRRSGRLGHR